MVSSPDEIVLSAAWDQGRILLTEDTDFGFLVVRRRLASRGVILLGMGALPWGQRLGRLAEEMARLGPRLEGSFTVVSRDKTRCLLYTSPSPRD